LDLFCGPCFSTSSIFTGGQDEEHAEAGGKIMDTELDLSLWASPSCMQQNCSREAAIQDNLERQERNSVLLICVCIYILLKSWIWIPKIHWITGRKFRITWSQWTICHRFSKLQLHYSV